MNEYAHLSDKTKSVVQLWDKQITLKYIEDPLWIQYPKASKLLNIMHEYMNNPTKIRMQSLLIIGDPNMGKSEVIQKFVDMNPIDIYVDNEGLKRIRQPVILTLANPSTSVKNLYTSILHSFHTSFSPSSSTIKLEYQVYALMREHQVKVLIIDELHNILETTITKQRIVMNAIKNISNELKIPIIGVGINTVARVLMTDPQHASRFHTVELTKWKLDANFAGLLKAFEKALPLAKPSFLSKQKKATLLYNISKGNLGNLHTLLKICTKYAIEQDIHEITMEIIEKHKHICPTDKTLSVQIEL